MAITKKNSNFMETRPQKLFQEKTLPAGNADVCGLGRDADFPNTCLLFCRCRFFQNNLR